MQGCERGTYMMEGLCFETEIQYERGWKGWCDRGASDVKGILMEGASDVKGQTSDAKGWTDLFIPQIFVKYIMVAIVQKRLKTPGLEDHHLVQP